MKTLTLLCLALSAFAVHAPAQVRAPREPFTLYAQFTADTRISLSDGSEWSMDRGDCFPVDMFKEHQTKVILKLGAATFTTDAVRVRIMKENEKGAALASYRITLENYLKTQSQRWMKQASGEGKPSDQSTAASP